MVSGQLGACAVDSEVPVSVVGAVTKDWAAVLVSGRLSSLSARTGIPVLSPLRSRGLSPGRVVNAEVVAIDGVEDAGRRRLDDSGLCIGRRIG